MLRGIHLAQCFVTAACALRVVSAGADDADKLEKMPAAQAIPAITQLLVDALPGDSAVWQRYLSEQAIYVGETGEVATKPELLKDFAPFPPGLEGSIHVAKTRITDLGDVVIAVVDLDEKQRVYDQRLEVSYRTTHIWRRESGNWRLIAAHAVVLAMDPPALPIDTRRLADYAGIYEISGKRRYKVEQRGDTLLGGRENAELTPLIAVGDNVFFEKGSNLGVLRIFVRGGDGKVERMVQRRKFADLNWLRLPAASSDK